MVRAHHVMAGRAKKNSNKQPGEGLMDVLNISADWDTHEIVRDRLREGGDLLAKDSDSDDILTVVRNKELLTPMVERMALLPGKPHPPIDPLREEVAKMYEKAKRSPMPEFKHLQHIAWRLRHLVCFVKLKARREEVSTETLLQSNLTHLFSRSVSSVLDFEEPPQSR